MRHFTYFLLGSRTVLRVSSDRRLVHEGPRVDANISSTIGSSAAFFKGANSVNTYAKRKIVRPRGQKNCCEHYFNADAETSALTSNALWVAAAFAHGGCAEGGRVIERLAAIYGRNNLYLELQRHQQRDEEARKQLLLRLASSSRLPVTATIQYVYECYGQLGAAMTANVISYRGRSAAREVGKALGFEEDQLARLTSLVGYWEWRGEYYSMAHHFAQAGFDIRYPRIARYLDLCLRVQNLPRHLGQHSGGMVSQRDFDAIQAGRLYPGTLPRAYSASSLHRSGTSR